MLLIELFWTAGILGEASLAWVILPNLPANLGWRWLLGVTAVPLLLIVAVYPQIPESMRYYLVKVSFGLNRYHKRFADSLWQGKARDALEVLKTVAQDNKQPLPCTRVSYGNTSLLPAYIIFDKGKLTDVNTPKARFADLLSPVIRKTTILLWVLWFVNTFVYRYAYTHSWRDIAKYI